MKKYIELSKRIKDMIISGELKINDKVPSVRQAAELYSVSLTTVQNAYFELCAGGYIIAKEKSGYYVSQTAKPEVGEKNETSPNRIIYDLSGGAADAESFDFALWQRYIKSALRQEERLVSYSTAKGEYDLRVAISKYIRQKRNVTASADRIIIGAGVQPLLHILAALLNNKKTVSFPDKSFTLGRSLFSNYGFEVLTRDKNADIIYVSPSHMTRWGDVMPIKRRLELTEYSSKNGSLVIEDDFENEFLYNVRPTPSLYTLGKGNVVYIGSFSAMLLPGIRISFMVLTEELSALFDKNQNSFAQTASKTEQIALCGFISDGHINSRVAKVRRLYSAKTKIFAEELKTLLPKAKIEIGENTLQIVIKTTFKGKIGNFEANGIRVFTEKFENENLVLVLSPSGVVSSELKLAAEMLANIISAK